MCNKLNLLIIISLFSLGAFGQAGIIPAPSEVVQPARPGSFQISGKTPIILSTAALSNSMAFFNDYLGKFYGFTLTAQNAQSRKGIYLKVDSAGIQNKDSYRLEVKKNGVYITGSSEEAVFYGIQSLIQLLPVKPASKLQVPYVTINDAPRFSYRGMHLDVSRHFFPVSFVKKYIDFLALHKMNYFHWHLTDDQGWRIEIKKYPKLTTTGAYRDGTIIGHYPGTGNDGIRHGGFYTQDEVRDVVAYAAARYVNVIPEIEMPGHASAALTAYPNLGCTGGPYKVQGTWGVFNEVFCAGNDSVFTFL